MPDVEILKTAEAQDYHQTLLIKHQADERVSVGELPRDIATL
jgi:hypothetical protein